MGLGLGLGMNGMGNGNGNGNRIIATTSIWHTAHNSVLANVNLANNCMLCRIVDLSHNTQAVNPAQSTQLCAGKHRFCTILAHKGVLK